MRTVSINEFAGKVHQLLRTDRDCSIGVGGFTGEGKSTFASKLAKAYAEESKMEWNFNHMTWSRKELMKWIDGDPKTGEGQMPEYSVIVPDELFLMFYRRNWFDDGQVDGIATFNMCRDRHLLVIGNVPDFWDLDSAFTKRIRFYVYIPIRGVAWVFEQENNPFTQDSWNSSENKKMFRKTKDPYKIPNFLFEIHFDDWDKKEKAEYYAIRNVKRVEALRESQGEKGKKYTKVKGQRDSLIKWISTELYYQDDKGYHHPTQEAISEFAGITRELVSMILNGTEKDDR
jgi:hypothetical protein